MVRYGFAIFSYLAFAGFLSPANAATLPIDPPFIITISFKEKLTSSYLAELETGTIVKHRAFDDSLRDVTFTYDTRDADYVSRRGNSISLEWQRSPPLLHI